MEGFCKGCLIKYDDPGLLLQYTEKNRRLYVYSTGLQVKRNDPLPFQLCKECYMNMKQSCKFKKQCRTSDKRFKNYLALKETGDVTDFCTYLKNNDDSFMLKFPIVNDNTTPLQKAKDDDNESTCTSIRNFMSDILHADEIPDTEARIIREVIEEEADILEDSLDSHWLQDDVSIDTDFRLDFNFSPFSTPRLGHNECFQTPQTAYREPFQTPQKEYDQNQETGKIIDQESFIAAKKILLRTVPSTDKPDDNENNITTIKNEDEVTENIGTDLESLDTISSYSGFFKENNETKNEGKQNNITVPIRNEEISENIGTDLESQDKISGYGDLLKENNEMNNEGKQIEISDIEDKRDNINLNLEKALKNTENTNFSLEALLATPKSDAVLATPPIQPGASGLSTPTIQNIIFGEKIDPIGEISNLELKGSEGGCDILDDFFNKETGEYIGDVNKKEEKEIFEEYQLLKTDPLDKPGKSKYDLSDYSCKLCNKRFDSQKALRIHFAKFHKFKIPGSRRPELVEEVICDHCGKTYNRLSNLRHHIKDKHYNVKSKLFDRTTSDEVFRCERCSLECKTKATLAIHMTTHTGKRTNTLNKNYVCSVCGHVSSCNSNLKTHMRRHTKEYLYNCSECGRGYFRKTDLNSHLRSHSGERPFPCSYCPRRFSRRDGLNTHMKLHTDERPFVCTFCHTSFVKTAQLRVHMLRSKKCIERRALAISEETDSKIQKYSVKERIVQGVEKDKSLSPVAEDIEMTDLLDMDYQGDGVECDSVDLPDIDEDGTVNVSNLESIDP